ncbi:MAG: TolC family protein, partial [Clostridia bacterium]|nr:TolC family protein [Deltaproteobacteria bacterium]
MRVVLLVLMSLLAFPATPAKAARDKVVAEVTATAPVASGGGGSQTESTAPGANAEAFQNKLDALITPANGLTAEEAARRSVKTSFVVEQNRQTLESNEALRRQARWNFLPQLNAQGSYTRVRRIEISLQGFTFSNIVNQWAFGGQLVVPISDYLFLLPQTLAATRKTRDASQLIERNSELTAATDTKVAYYEWTRSKLQVVVQEQALEQARAQSRDANAQFEAGASTRADVLRLESQVATTELNLANARTSLANSEEQLRTQMHDDDRSVTYAIGEDVRADLEPLQNVDDVNALWQEAEGKRLDIQATGLQAAAQEERARVARAGSLPTIQATGLLQEVNPLTQRIPQQEKFEYYWQVGATLNWNLLGIFGNESAVDSAKAQALAITAQQNQTRDTVHVNVLTAYNSLKVAEIALDTTGRALTSSEESYRVRRALY